jgi:DNA processing protein
LSIVNMLTLGSPLYPSLLATIPSPPKVLFVRGLDLPALTDKPRLAVVGSRRISPYGKQVTTQLVARLAEQGIIIISGLAYGVDKTAHEAALEAGGTTIAVLPGPLESIVPASHRRLADRIIQQGGALVSEYPVGSPVFKQNFIARNRIVAGIAEAVLITEAAEKSGSLHTARFALEQGKDVMAVPGNITSPVSKGTNNLVHAGAVPVRDHTDVTFALGLEPGEKAGAAGSNTAEQAIIDLLALGMSDGPELLAVSGLDAALFNQTIAMLEIRGIIRPLGGNRWMLG